MKTKRISADQFEKAQFDLYTYIDWLENTGRITPEEHTKLLDATTDCVIKAISFGYSGESA